MRKRLLFLSFVLFINSWHAQVEDLTPQELILKTQLNKQTILNMCLNTFNYTCFEDSLHQNYYALFSSHIYNKVKAKFIKELISNPSFSDYATFLNLETNSALAAYTTFNCSDWETLIHVLENQGNTTHHHAKAAGDPCTNPDFEMCDFTNWELQTGNVPGNALFSLNGIQNTTNFVNINNGATNLAGTASHAIVSGGNDVNGGFPMVNPNGGCSALLGDFEESGANAAILTQTFLVSPNDAVLILNYAAVLEDPNHNQNQQPYFRVRVFNELGLELNCGSYEAYAGDGQPGWLQGGGMDYLPWTTVMIPLDAYIGQNVTVQFTVGDCSLGGHSGYAYVDASCQSLALALSGQDDCNFPVTISAPAGAASYNWTNGATTQSIDVYAPGNYGVQIVPNAGPACGALLDTTIIDFTPPTVDVGPDITICAGESAQLASTGTNIQNYTWDNAGTLDDNTLQSPVATPTVTTTYTLTVEGAPGCEETDQVTVTVQPYADATIIAENSVCDNSPILNFTSTQPNGTWTGLGIIDANTGAFDPSVAGAGTHTVMYTIGGLCPDTQTTTILVEPFADPSITQVGPFCETAQAIQLQAVDIGGVWAGNGITDTQLGYFSPSVAGAGNHLISYTTPGGCGSTDQITILVGGTVDATIVQEPNLCFNAPSFNLTSVEANGIWSGTGIIDQINGTFDAATAGSGTHSITYTITAICSDSQTTTLTVYPQMQTSAEEDTLICEGGTAFLEAFATFGSGTYTYNWDNGNNQASQYVSPTTNTIYTVTINDGCSVNTETVEINIEYVPIIQFSADDLEGCAPMTVELLNLSAAGCASCLWTVSNGYSEDNCTGITTVLENAGCYDVNLQLTTPIGCTDNLWYNNYICVQDYPEANFLPSQSVMTLIDTEVEFENLSTGADSYFWNLGDAQVTSTDFEVTHTYPNEDAGYYEIELIASTSFGCSDSITIGIEVLDELIVYVPNTFTPDNDNFNELWKPVFDTGYDPQSLDLYIFNRWGEIIWESHDVDAGWNGSYGISREPVRDGTYLWKMEFSERSSDKRHLLTGHVNVLK